MQNEDVEQKDSSCYASQYIDQVANGLKCLDHEKALRWGFELAFRLAQGSRILVAGNGGSAAQAEHFTAELTGRFETDRRPLSAIALTAESSTVTALANDMGYDTVFERQVKAHGRPGDIFMAISTSGESRNLLRAVNAAHELGATTWALTGRAPNTLSRISDDQLEVPLDSTAQVQDCQMTLLHLICSSIDSNIDSWPEQPRQLVPVATPVPKSLKIVIVGDCLLDIDIQGEADRLSPEAPVPVVSNPRHTNKPGGAGLSAVLARRMGHHVTLVSAIGPDSKGKELQQSLETAGVHVLNLGSSSPTPTKMRIRAKDQTLLMVDDSCEPFLESGLINLKPEVWDAIDSAEAIVVSDYGRGVAGNTQLRKLLEGVAARTPIVWDPHPRGPRAIQGVKLLTPNSKEGRILAHEATMGKDLKSDFANALSLCRSWRAQNVALTRGSEGAILASPVFPTPIAIPAPDIAANDTCGVGDLFAVQAAASLAAGMIPSDAVKQAVDTASKATATGVHAWDPCGQHSSGPLSASALASKIRQKGGTLVVAAGCFDLLHAGHVSLLEQARALGDSLIVCINSDESVKELKGSNRPLVSANDRSAVLQALSCVDAVEIFPEANPEAILDDLKPNIYAKGGDYARGDIPETSTVERHGGVVVIVPYLDGRSSTSLIERAASFNADAMPDS